MTEDQRNRWELVFKGFGPLLTVVAIIVGVWQFDTGERNRQRQEVESLVKRDRLEFRRRLWVGKLETYKQLAELTGEVIATHEMLGPRADEAYSKFIKTYWGAMMMVQNDEVERAMIAFQAELVDYRSGWSKDIGRLKDRADILLKKCRKNVEDEGLALNANIASEK